MVRVVDVGFSWSPGDPSLLAVLHGYGLALGRGVLPSTSGEFSEVTRRQTIFG
jgi:hypothetical protein